MTDTKQIRDAASAAKAESLGLGWKLTVVQLCDAVDAERAKVAALEAQVAALRSELRDAASQMREVAKVYDDVVCNAAFGGEDEAAEMAEFERVDDSMGALARGCGTMADRFDAALANTADVAARYFSEGEIAEVLAAIPGVGVGELRLDATAVLAALKARRKS